MDTLTERFIRYAKIDTQSRDDVESTPSTPGQRELARLLADELSALGLERVTVTDHAYVTAFLPGRACRPDAPTIGLVAHLDTATECSGANVRPRVVENYDGGPIELGNSLRLDPESFPVLKKKAGKTLIVTDGATLLGADDKAGIAVIMEVLSFLSRDAARAHPPVAVAFTPDEEIGHGARLLDLPSFGANFAFTVDGGGVGTIECENFNAALATVTIRGLSIHPGEAKGKMVNAILLGQAFLDSLPPRERPENTDGREGFFHVESFSGSVGSAEVRLLVRDHDADAFAAKKRFLRDLLEWLNLQWPAEAGASPRFALELKDQYRNMAECVQPHMHIIENAKNAMRAAGVEPLVNPIRGGTDGAQLSWCGLPCPNLFNGSYNVHGPYEFVVVEEMRLSVETILGVLGSY